MVTIFIISGCDASRLNDIEETSRKYQECLVFKIMPYDCDERYKALELAELRARKNGIAEERIEASLSIGEKLVSGSTADSIYGKIYKSITQGPFFLTPQLENFKPYSNRCGETDRIGFDLIGNRPKDKFYTGFRVISYLTTGRTITFLLTKSRLLCRPDSYLEIEEGFPILTEEQVLELKSGKNLRDRAGSRYSNAVVEVYDSSEEAIARYHEIKNNRRE